MNDKIIILLTCLLIIIITSNYAAADQLVYTIVEDNQSSEKKVSEYTKPIFCEERFILSLQPNEWRPIETNQQVISQWKNNRYYFVLYPLREYDASEVNKYGTILNSETNYKIFVSNRKGYNNTF